MLRIEIYTKSYCFYCHRAKALLREEGVEFEEIDVTRDNDRRQEMIVRAGRRTVPQIFINGTHIGGSDELAILHANGELGRIIDRLKSS